MKLGYTKKVNLSLGISMLIGPLMMITLFLNPLFFMSWMGSGIFLLGFALFVFGCVLYAKGKGYHGAWGLLGLLAIPGLVVLAFFPDRHKGEDENTGCLFVLLFILLLFVLVFGPIIYISTKMFKVGRNPTNMESQQLKDSWSKKTIKIDGMMLRASHADLGTKIKSMDSLLKEGESGIAELRESLQFLKQNPKPAKDDDIVIRRIEESLAALGPVSSTMPSQVLGSTTSVNVVSTSAVSAIQVSTATVPKSSPVKKAPEKKKRTTKKSTVKTKKY